MRTVTKPTAALLLVGSMMLAAPALAQVSPSTPQPVQKVYAVADLIAVAPQSGGSGNSSDVPACCPHAGLWTSQTIGSNGEEKKLIQLLTSTVRPKCWASAGGNCAIEYFPIGMGLVVSAPDDVQREIECALECLRQKQVVNIAVTTRFITVSDEFFERFGLDLDLSNGVCKPDCCDKRCCDESCFDKNCCEKGCCDKNCCEKGVVATRTAAAKRLRR